MFLVVPTHIFTDLCKSSSEYLDSKDDVLFIDGVDNGSLIWRVCGVVTEIATWETAVVRSVPLLHHWLLLHHVVHIGSMYGILLPQVLQCSYLYSLDDLLFFAEYFKNM